MIYKRKKNQEIKSAIVLFCFLSQGNAAINPFIFLLISSLTMKKKVLFPEKSEEPDF